MCGRYVLKSPPATINTLFQISGVLLNFPAGYNIAPTQGIPIVRMAPTGVRELAFVRWGLVPSWAKEITNPPLINARADTAADKPSFRTALRRRRCLIPADGIYEWDRSGSGPARPYYIHPTEGGLFAMAGLWESWMTAEGSELESAAILTTDANPRLSAIHHRMPCVLPPETWDRWLDHTDETDLSVQELLKPAPDDAFTAYRIATAVNKVANDGPELLEPVTETAQDETDGPDPDDGTSGQMSLF